MTVAEVHAAAAVAAAAAPAPMTAAEAHTAAAEEGLALVRAENSTGFKGVYRGGAKSSAGKPFKAELRNKSLGYFATAEEAALAVARFLGPEGVAAALAPPAPEPPPMTAAEARAEAAAEGLSLVPAENATGFKGVYLVKSASKPFSAQLWHGGRPNNLGTFATAEEAALTVARFLGSQ